MEFQRLGQHWRYSDQCEYPEPDQRQDKIIKGLVMSDASVERGGENPSMEIQTVTKEFARWIDSELGSLSSGVKERPAASNRPESKNEIVAVRLWSNPNLRKYSEWYSSGEKRFPEDIDLSPLTVKVWYCGDGHLGWSGHYTTKASPGFGVTNESDRLEFLSQKFREVGFNTRTEERGIVVIDRDEIADFFDWLGKPLPGFECKWQFNNPDKYKELQQ